MPAESARVANALSTLTAMQRAYVKARLEGMSKVASATAAGQANPKANAHKFEESEAVVEALRVVREADAATLLFGRKQAFDLYMQAYYSAATSAEMVMAVNGIVKLLGLAAPEVKELRHKHSGLITHRRLEDMPDGELAQLAQLKESPWIDGEFTEVLPEPVCLPLNSAPPAKT